MDWDTYCQLGMCYQPPAHGKHLLPGPDGRPQGFATATGKIELASEALDALGGPRLPELGEPRRLCSGGFIAAREAEGWTHLPLITGARKQPYNASMYFNNEAFRRRHPYPVAEMSEATAAALGLSSGDTVVLATDRGEARFVLDTIRMRDGLINADYGWWHPEWAAGAPAFGGMWESNINCLTSCSVDEGEPMIGTWSYNAIDCMVRRDDRPLSWQPGFTPDPAAQE